MKSLSYSRMDVPSLHHVVNVQAICLNVGCVPSKAILRCSHVVREVSYMCT